MSKEKRSSQSVERKFLITNSKQLEQNKNAKFYGKNCDCGPEGVSVSQSSVRFDGSGQPDGKINVDQSVTFGVTRFSEDIQTVRMADRSGQLEK